MRRIGRVLPALLGALVLCSCAPLAKRTPPPEALPVSNLELDSLRSKLHAASQSVSSFKALARAVIESRWGKEAFRYAIAFERPGRLRVEILPTAAAYTLGLLCSNEDGGTFLDVQERKAYRSPDPAVLIDRFLKIPLSESDFMSLIVGRLPDRFISGARVYRADGRLYLSGEEPGFYAELDETSLLIRFFELRSEEGDGGVVRLTSGEVQPGPGHAIPQTLLLELPDLDAGVRLSFTSINTDVAVSNSLFTIRVPAGFETIELGKE